MRARLALKSAGITVALREILLRDKPDAFLAASKSATVPVLELKDGRIIEESLDIMFWALQEGGDPDMWLSGWTRRKKETLAFLDELDGEFKTNLDRYKYATRYAANPKSVAELAIVHRDRGCMFLCRVAARLEKEPFLNGQSAGLEDYAALPFVRQFRIADINWFDQQEWPALHDWLQAFLKSDTFADVMHKYTPWQKHDEPFLF
jgi:glutathione S-transferase